MTKILILAAAGQISRILNRNLLKETNYSIALYARDAHRRINVTDKSREEIISGDFSDEKLLTEAISGVDVVYMNELGNTDAVKLVVKLMKAANVKRFIGASILGIYDEVGGAFGKWNHMMIGEIPENKAHRESAAVIENSGLDYTLLRLSWLYNQEDNEKYTLTNKGEPFYGAQVTREAVARLVIDILADDSNKFIGASVGVGEPDTDFDKPSFY